MAATVDSSVALEKFNCALCYETFETNKGILLECGHRYDNSCISCFIESSINENKVSQTELCCPDCLQPLSEIIISKCISNKSFSKYIRFKSRLLGLEVKMLSYKCMYMSCNYITSYEENTESITCKNCTRISCPNCGSDPHIGLTCQESIASKAYAEIQFEEEFRAAEEKQREIHNEFLDACTTLGFKKCPHCNSMCERIGGCNFMKCYSRQCAGKKNFCLLCELPIADAEHYNHYKTDGPFGKTCNNLDNIIKA